MNQLENRETKILKFLVDERDYVPVHIIARKLNISTKTVYRNIEKIIEKRSDVKLLKKQGKGIKIELLEIPLEELTENKFQKDSLEERRKKILYYLLKNTNNYSTIEELSELYYVGKSSIVNDLSYIEADLLTDNLVLKKDRKGTRIIGNEKDIRKKLSNLIKGNSFISDNPVEEYFSNRISKETITELATKFDIDKIFMIERIIEKHEKKLPYTIGDLYYTNLVVHILIAIERIKKDNYIQEENSHKISDKNFYLEAENIAIELEREFSLTLPDSEIYYIYQYLVSTGVGNLNSNIVVAVDKETENLFFKFLENVTNQMKVEINGDENIYYLFKLHIRALLRRLKYGINVKNPLLEKIKKEYVEAFYSIKNIAENIFKQSISDDEIAYLTIYIESILNTNIKRIKTVLVCNSGLGTSLFLKKRIEDKFNNLEVLDVISAKELEKYDVSIIDFVISTVKIEEKRKDVINVNVMLYEDDIRNINRKVYGESYEI